MSSTSFAPLQIAADHLRTISLVTLTLINHCLALVFVFVDFVAYSLIRVGGSHSEADDEFVELVAEQLEAANELDVAFYDDYVEPIFIAVLEKAMALPFLVFVWFGAFVVPFSHSVGATASNEYLLFCCITFTLFAVYSRLASLAFETFNPVVTTIHTDACQQVNKAVDVCDYHTHVSAECETSVISFEQLLVLLAVDVGQTHEADEVLIEQALVVSASNALQELSAAEGAEELLDEALEEMDIDEESLDEITEDLDLA